MNESARAFAPGNISGVFKVIPDDDPFHVPDHAKDEARDHTVEGAVRERKPFAYVRDDAYVSTEISGLAAEPSNHVRVRLDERQSRLRRVERQVGPGASADLQKLCITPQPLDCVLSDIAVSAHHLDCPVCDILGCGGTE